MMFPGPCRRPPEHSTLADVCHIMLIFLAVLASGLLVQTVIDLLQGPGPTLAGIEAGREGTGLTGATTRPTHGPLGTCRPETESGEPDAGATLEDQEEQLEEAGLGGGVTEFPTRPRDKVKRSGLGAHTGRDHDGRRHTGARDGQWIQEIESHEYDVDRDGRGWWAGSVDEPRHGGHDRLSARGGGDQARGGPTLSRRDHARDLLLGGRGHGVRQGVRAACRRPRAGGGRLGDVAVREGHRGRPGGPEVRSLAPQPGAGLAPELLDAGDAFGASSAYSGPGRGGAAGAGSTGGDPGRSTAGTLGSTVAGLLAGFVTAVPLSAATRGGVEQGGRHGSEGGFASHG